MQHRERRGHAPCPLCLAFFLAALAPACAPSRGTIGAVLGQRADGRLFVRDVPDGLAADKEGLAPGDELLLVDGRDVRTMDDRTLHARLSGDVDTPVKLTLVRGEAVIRVTLRRTPAKRRPREAPSGGGPPAPPEGVD